MPPKKSKSPAKKAKKDAPAAAAAPAQPDEFENLDLETLRAKVKEQTDALAELRRNRNFYQLERDQISKFYDIVRQEVVDTEANVRNIESQMERMEETHRNDIRIYLQKVIHLEYELANNIAAVQKEAEAFVSEEEKKHVEKKVDLEKAKSQLKQTLESDEVAHEDEIRALKETERKEMLKLREEFEKNHQELQKKYDAALEELRDELELRRKMEIHEIEERKNKHINDLMRNHERAFEEMRTYYNSITHDNLDLIRTFKEDLVELKARAAENEKTIDEITHRNEMLSEPLAHAEERVNNLKQKLANYQKDKASLKLARGRLGQLEDKLKALLQSHEMLKEKYQQIEAERDSLYQNFELIVRSVQSQSQEKNTQLEHKLDEIKEVFDTKRAQFSSVLRASNLDPVALKEVTSKLEDMLNSKQDRLQELRYEAAKVQKMHNDLVNVYEAKLNELGVPAEEVHVRERLGVTSTAPADLLS